MSSLFSDFLYRVKGWSKGNSSRYFTKKDISLFKGINLNDIDKYPYLKIIKIADAYVNNSDRSKQENRFPFQLDQTIINGRYFFELITYYKNLHDHLLSNLSSLSSEARIIMTVLDTYEGKDRTGDKYVRMLFDCALLYYIDKFGDKDISKAIEKIFIWAYSLRLSYQSLQLASVDNYVVDEFNLFKKIREAIYKEEIINLELPFLHDDNDVSTKTAEIKSLFIKMNYCANAK